MVRGFLKGQGPERRAAAITAQDRGLAPPNSSTPASDGGFGDSSVGEVRTFSPAQFQSWRSKLRVHSAATSNCSGHIYCFLECSDAALLVFRKP